MAIIGHILGIVIVAFIVILGGYVYYKHSPLGKFWKAAVGIKVLAGYAHAALYFWYYKEGDLVTYHHDSIEISHYAYQNFSRFVDFIFFNSYIPLPNLENITIVNQARALYMLKLNSVLYALCWQNIWIVIALLSCLSAWVMWLFANELCYWFPKHKLPAAVAFLFFPSVVFWSAGINKETYALIALYGILFIVFRWQRQGFYLLLGQKIVYLLALFALTYGLLQIKFYYLAVLIPCLGTWVLWRSLQQYAPHWVTQRYLGLAFLGVCSATIFVGISFAYPDLGFYQVAQNIIRNHNVVYIFSSSQDLIHFYKLNTEAYITLAPSLESWLLNMPIALFSALFRPFVWEAGNKIQLLASLENTILLVVFLYAIKQLVQKKVKISYHSLVLLTLLYIALLAILLAFSSPNLGSLNRFRVSFMPFVLYLMLIVLNTQPKQTQKVALKNII